MIVGVTTCDMAARLFRVAEPGGGFASLAYRRVDTWRDCGRTILRVWREFPFPPVGRAIWRDRWIRSLEPHGRLTRPAVGRAFYEVNYEHNQQAGSKHLPYLYQTPPLPFSGTGPFMFSDNYPLPSSIRLKGEQ